MSYEEYRQARAKQRMQEEAHRADMLKVLRGKTIETITTKGFDDSYLYITIHTTCGQHYTLHCAALSAQGYGLLEINFDEQELYRGEG